jgi:hypothetical protein
VINALGLKLHIEVAEKIAWFGIAAGGAKPKPVAGKADFIFQTLRRLGYSVSVNPAWMPSTLGFRCSTQPTSPSGYG